MHNFTPVQAAVHITSMLALTDILDKLAAYFIPGQAAEYPLPCCQRKWKPGWTMYLRKSNPDKAVAGEVSFG